MDKTPSICPRCNKPILQGQQRTDAPKVVGTDMTSLPCDGTDVDQWTIVHWNCLTPQEVASIDELEKYMGITIIHQRAPDQETEREEVQASSLLFLHSS